AGAAAAARRRRACRRAESGRSRRWLPRPVGKTRRRRRTAPPSSSTSAAPIARARSPDTTWPPTAPPARTPPAGGARPPRPLPRIGVDPVAHRLVEVSHEYLLVVEGIVAERALLDSHLRAVERPAVLEPVVLERERGVLVGQALARVPGGHEVEIALEHVRI